MGNGMSGAQDSMDTVLERKARAQRRALGVGAVSVTRALGRSLSLAADALWTLSLGANTHSDAAVSTARAVGALSDDQLLIVLEKDGAPHALVAIDRAVVTGLTEVQTLGKVTRFPLEDRPYTATDAAMVAPFIDAVLPRFSSMLVGQPERAHLQGYAYGALVEDVQSAGLALDAARFQAIALDINLAQDVRRGQALFLFPEPEQKPAADSVTRPGKYEAAMKLVPTRLQAVLTRIHIPLEQAQALRPGDVLPLSTNVLGAATLTVDGGHVAAKGKLGQINGFRAVRIGCDAPLVHGPAPDMRTGEAAQTLPAVTEPKPRFANDLTLDLPQSLSFDSLSSTLN